VNAVGPLYNLLSTTPGSFVYHLLVLLALEAVAGIALIEYRHTRNPDQYRLLWAFSALFLLRVPLLVGGPLGRAFLAPLLYALEVVSLTLMWWAFLSPLLGRRVGRAFLLGNLLAAVALTAAFLPSWNHMVSVAPFFEYAAFWQQPLWDLWATLIPLSAAAVLLAYRERLGYSLPAVSFALMALGNGLTLFDQVGLGRLVNLVAYPLLAVTVYRAALQDLWAYRQELETLSEESLRQTRELRFLVEISRAIGESLDLPSILQRVVESVARALNADRAAILMTAEKADRIWLAAQYTLLQTRTDPRTAPPVPIADQPVLSHAVRRQRPLLLNPESNNQQLQSLYAMLGSQETGPVIIQPLTRQRRTLGALIVANDHSKRRFGDKEGRLCNSIAVQISAAIDNARLYQRLKQQTQHMAQALQAREEKGS
jgi:hypothetical protein